MWTPTRAPARAWGFLALRVGMLFAITVLLWGVTDLLLGSGSFSPNPIWGTLALLPVNILCLWLLRRLYHAEGRRLRDVMGVRPGRVGVDVLWGLLWLVVLGIPFVVAVVATTFALHGSGTVQAFETIFFDPTAPTPTDPWILLSLGVVGALPFMAINAPVEELLYRRYAQDGLAARYGTGGAMVLASLVFGLQHIVFVPVGTGMVVYFVAFTAWGLAAAGIVRRQGRLLPVIIAHGLVNVGFGSLAIVFPVLMLAGVPLT